MEVQVLSSTVDSRLAGYRRLSSFPLDRRFSPVKRVGQATAAPAGSSEIRRKLAVTKIRNDMLACGK